MPLAITLLFVALFLAMNAFFVVAEFSMVRVRSSQIEMAFQSGAKGARYAKKISDNVNDYLSACQLGITLASLALGWLGEPAFSQLLRPLLSLFNLSEVAISAIAVGVGYFIMTSLHVVVGELIPKSFAIFSTEKYALKTAAPLYWFYYITYPVMWLFNHLTNSVVRLFGHDAADESEVYTDEEIKLLIDRSTESGLIRPEQNEIVDNVFDLGDKDAEAIMTPRTDLVCLDTEDTLEENLKVVRTYKYTRYPITQGSKDRIIGFVHVKDIYENPDITSIEELNIRNIPAVLESAQVARVMQVLQEDNTKIAIVIDEHGGTSGIVTMTDIMEQIVGCSQDEYTHGTHAHVVSVGENEYLVDGIYPIDDTVELLGFEPEEAQECETAGGLLLSLFDRIPEEGDRISVSDERGRQASFLIADMDRHRIDKIHLKIMDDENAKEN